MILYLDTSALVKQLVTEVGSSAVDRFVATAQTVGTSIITIATFDAQLWQAGQPIGLSVWPEDLARFRR